MLDSKKYAEVCPDAVKRIYERELKNRGSEKEAEKATKAKLHQLTGAFMTPEEMRKARGNLQRYLAGDETALTDTLRLHSSTRERLSHMDELYDKVFSVTGRPDIIYDLACGINPLYLGSKGLTVRGYDVGGGQVRIVNEWAEAAKWDVQCGVCDLVGGLPCETGGLTLMMKLLPVLETQEKGSGYALLKAIRGWALVTFPTKTLGGRKIGMEETYAARFEAEIPKNAEIKEKFMLADELCYIVFVQNAEE